MAVTQTVDQRRGANPYAVKDDDGYWYTEQGGGTRLYVGSGSPNGIITAPIGSRYLDQAASGLVWYNTDGSTTWAEVGDIT